MFMYNLISQVFQLFLPRYLYFLSNSPFYTQCFVLLLFIDVASNLLKEYSVFSTGVLYMNALCSWQINPRKMWCMNDCLIWHADLDLAFLFHRPSVTSTFPVKVTSQSHSWGHYLTSSFSPSVKQSSTNYGHGKKSGFLWTYYTIWKICVKWPLIFMPFKQNFVKTLHFYHTLQT